MVFQVELVPPHGKRRVGLGASNRFECCSRLSVLHDREGRYATQILGPLEHGDGRAAAVIPHAVEHDLVMPTDTLSILDPLRNESRRAEVVHIPIRVVREDAGPIAPFPEERVVRKLG